MKEALLIAFKYYQHFGPVKKNPHRDHVLFLMYPALLCFRRVQWGRNPLPEFDIEPYTNPLVSIIIPLHYDNVVPVVSHFFLTFLFLFYAMERHNIHVMQWRNIAIGQYYFKNR